MSVTGSIIIEAHKLNLKAICCNYHPLQDYHINLLLPTSIMTQHNPLIAPIILKIKIQPLTIAPNIPKMTLIDI